MSFVDMAFLKKKDLQNGILTYRRNKTGQQLFIKWEKPMQELIDKYDTSDTPYLLPIIRNSSVDEWHQYQNAAHRINRNKKMSLAKVCDFFAKFKSRISLITSKETARFFVLSIPVYTCLKGFC